MTLEGTYGVPTVAVHTDKFDRVVRSVATLEELGVPLGGVILNRVRHDIPVFLDGML